MARNKAFRMVMAAIVAIALQLGASAFALAAPLSSRPQIAIGFDDAPTPSSGNLLAILQEKHVKATFFMIGEEVENYPDEARAIASAGMLIGNHSYDHPDFTTATAQEIYDNLSHAQTVIHAYTGVTPHWYRSPFLSWNDAYDTVLPELGLQISWPTINPKDWDPNTTPQNIIDAVLYGGDLAPGGVVELHDIDGLTNTVEALPDLIDGLEEHGYGLVTLDDIGLGAIEGHVSTASGPALSGVLVTAYNTGGSAVATASTDDTGWYRLARLSAGSYRVGFSRSGYLSRYYDAANTLPAATPVAVNTDYATLGVDASLISADTTPPVTTISTLPAGWVDHDVAFSLEATDVGGSGVAHTYFGLNAPATSTYSAEVTVTAEGTTTVSYRSVDIAGNAEATKTARITIDKTPPATTDDHAATYYGSATVHLSATDALSGVASTRYTLDGTAGSGTLVAVSGIGVHTLAYASIDNADNTEATHTVTFSVATPDTTPPVTTSDAKASYVDFATVTLTPTDADSGVAGTWYSLDGTAEISGTSVTVTTPGSHTLAFWSRDVAGNTELAHAVTFVVEATARLSVHSAVLTPAYGTGTTISGTLQRAAAPNGGIAGQPVRLQTLSGGVWHDVQIATTDGAGAATFHVTPSAKASYRLSFLGAADTYLAAGSPTVVLVPKVKLGTPSAPKTVRRRASFTVSGSLLPRHTKGTKPVRIYRYRRVGGRWKSYGAVKAVVSNSGSGSRYKVRLKLSTKGSWRLRAYAPADAAHAATWSSGFRSLRVR